MGEGGCVGRLGLAWSDVGGWFMAEGGLRAFGGALLGPWIDLDMRRHQIPNPNRQQAKCGYGATMVRTMSAHNILLITVDDLRPQLNMSYGMPEMVTPNLDKFAAEATVFHRAFAQMAVCSPSRNSFMTGRRPDTTKVWNFINHFRESGIGEDWVALPQFFREHGYLSYGSGKLYHPAKPPRNDFGLSWTHDEHEPFYWGNGAPIGDALGCNPSVNLTVPLKEAWGSVATCQDEDNEAALAPDNRSTPQVEQRVEYDHRVATRAIEGMTRARLLNRSFFVAVGLRRPHLAWRHPARFYDLYRGKALAVAKHMTIGENVTQLAFERNGEMGQTYIYNGNESLGRWRESPRGPPLPDALQRELRRGYYASVSFMDYEVGRILDAVEALQLDGETAVIFHADHGWKLGEHGDWSKCTNWELDTRVPLIIRTPWLPSSIGKRTLAIAELVDLYPTAVALSGLPSPATEALEGSSLLPVLMDPENTVGVKSMAFSQYPRCPEFDMYTHPMEYECLETPKQNLTLMGFSVRDAEWRYTEWRNWTVECKAVWSAEGLVAQELYDHVGDEGRGAATFDDFEYESLSHLPVHQPVVERLARALLAQFSQNTGCK